MYQLITGQYTNRDRRMLEMNKCVMIRLWSGSDVKNPELNIIIMVSSFVSSAGVRNKKMRLKQILVNKTASKKVL